MIYPMVVLTAGHNLYDHKSKKKAFSVEYIPCPNENKLKFGNYNVKEFFFCENFINDEDEDYGILILEKKENEFCLGLYTGFFGLKIVDKLEDLEKKYISVFGYPGDKAENADFNEETKNKGNEMWGMGYKVDQENTEFDENGIIQHYCDTYKGQSGSPLLLRKGNNYFVIGIHVYGENNYNGAVLITEERLRNIQNWIIKHLGDNKNFYHENEIFNFEELKIQGR